MAEKLTMTEAFLAAQKEMEAPSKTAVNPHFHSKFAPLDEVLRVAKEALHKYGISVAWDSEFQGEVFGVVTVLTHADSGTIWRAGFHPVTIHSDPQKTASGDTYARRYSLQKAVGLAAEEDDDGNVAASSPAPSSGGTEMSDAQRRMVQALAKEAGYDADALKAVMHEVTGKSSSSELSKKDASALIDRLQTDAQKA